MMDRDGMMLTAFLMQPQPPPFALLVVTVYRTIPPATGSSDKYANLPMCVSESSLASPVFAWDKALHDAPLDVSCYLEKNLLQSYSASTPATMWVTSGCIIENHTAKEQSLVGSTSYDAILRGPEGGATAFRTTRLGSIQTTPFVGRTLGWKVSISRR